jgi:hypothetical protein
MMTSTSCHDRTGWLRCLGSACVITVALLLASPAAATIDASSAADVCPPDADPCVITETVRIMSPTVLDFGLRALELEAGAALLTNGTSLTIRCGELRSHSADVEIRLEGPSDTRSGLLVIEAAGTCSSGERRRCLDDRDCAAGTCSEGSGAIDLGATILGRGTEGSFVDVRAAGDVRLAGSIELAGRGEFGHGGFLTVGSGGSIILDAEVDTGGPGREASGGDVGLDAGNDITVNGRIDLRAGQFAGWFDAFALGDVRIAGDILSDAHGDGGRVSVINDGNIEIGNAAKKHRLRISTSGGESGDDQDYSAIGTVRIDERVLLTASGRGPLGVAGRITLDGGDGIVMDGTMAIAGDGPEVFLDAFDGEIRVSETAHINLSGPFADIDAESAGNFVMNGTVRIAGGREEAAIFLRSRRRLSIAGTLGLSAFAVGQSQLNLAACTFELLPTARVEARATDARIDVYGEAGVTLRRGSKLLGPLRTGGITVHYVDALDPPALNGTVRPDPQLDLVSSGGVCHVSPF